MKNNNLYKPCASCGESVHQKTPACKKCGAASPWKPRADSAVKNLGLPEITTHSDRPEFRPHIVLRKFEQIVGDVMVKLEEGKVLTDFNLVKRLLDAHAPIIEVGKEKDVCVCPSCSHIFIATGKNGRASA